MSKEMPETYTYEDNILRYEFRNNDFTNDLYKEFDHKAIKLGLNSKIDDLLSGKVVNLTENQAAFHPKYRKNKGFINEFIKSVNYENRFYELINLIALCSILYASHLNPKLFPPSSTVFLIIQLL